MELQKTVYAYDPTTLVYLGTTIADPSPEEEGVFLLPAFTTEDSPPSKIKDGNVARFVDGAWKSQLDTRGLWYKADRSVVMVEDFDTVIDSSWSRTEPAKPIEELKADKRAEINGSRALAVIAPITVGAYTYDADQTSQDLIKGALLDYTLGLPVPATWRLADNTEVVTTADTLKAVAAAIAQRTGEAYRKSWDLKAKVDVATTAEELAAIVW